MPPETPDLPESSSPAIVTLLGRERAALRKAAGGAPRLVTGAHAMAEPITMYGIPRPAWAELRRRWRANFAGLSLDERFALAGALLASHVEEEGHAGLAVLRGGLAEMTPAHYPILDRLAGDFTSWSMVDDFATGKAAITAALLVRYPEETLALLRAWRASGHRWKRRAGAVTFTRATAACGLYVDEVLDFAAAMRFEPEDLVQKAIGWALKDVMRAGPAAKRRAMALVKRMRREGVSSTITLYAIRDLEGAERDAVLAVKPGRVRTGEA